MLLRRLWQLISSTEESNYVVKSSKTIKYMGTEEAASRRFLRFSENCHAQIEILLTEQSEIF